MNLFETQFEFGKPHRLVWRLGSPEAPVAERTFLSQSLSSKDLEKQIQYWEKQLGPKGKELWADIKKDLEEYKKNFIKDAKKTLFHEKLVTTGGDATVYGEVANMFIYRIDQSGLSCLMKIAEMDQKFETQKTNAKGQERKKIEQQYESAVTALHQGIQEELQETVNQFSSTTEGFGKGVIDTESELALLKQNMNVLKDAGLSKLIVKLSKGRNLNHRDYEKILGGLDELMGQKIDTSRLDRATDSVRQIEIAGKTAILNLMSPAQRFKLGELLVKKANQNDTFSKEQAHQGLLTLSAMGFLDIGQVEILLGKLGLSLKQEEEKEIRKALEMMKEVRRKMEHSMKEGGGGNWIKKHITGSNVLIYEIAGRIGLLGMALPFVLNILHPEQWQHIIADPVWLGCTALSAASIDHITGGIGQGQMTKLIKGIGEKKEEETLSEREKRIIGKLDTMIGNSSGIFKFFRKILPTLNLKAKAYEDANQGKHYRFKWADLADANGVLPSEFKVVTKSGLSGFSPTETEQTINDFFSPMRYELGLADNQDMEKVLDGSPERRGLQTRSVA